MLSWGIVQVREEEEIRYLLLLIKQLYQYGEQGQWSGGPAAARWNAQFQILSSLPLVPLTIPFFHVNQRLYNDNAVCTPGLKNCIDVRLS